MLFELFDEGCFELLGWYETQGPLKASTPNHYQRIKTWGVDFCFFFFFTKENSLFFIQLCVQINSERWRCF